MYAFRKPYTIIDFGDLTVGTFDIQLGLKEALVISQVLGYTISKYVGMRFCSEISPKKRAAALVLLILVAELALVLFAVVPPSMKVLALFLNGIPLGAVWGLVFGFLEGRRTSDVLGAGLSCSYIVASGSVKSVGRLWLDMGIPPEWMPAITGFGFLPIFLLAVYLLNQLPPPDDEDIAERSKRVQMDSSQRWSFLRKNLAGLIPLLLLYFFLTAFRDFRDNFAMEIWSDMGLGNRAMVYAVPEFLIAFGVMAAMALLVLAKGNRNALIGIYLLMTVGAVIVGTSTYALDRGLISGPVWMTLTGLGLYLAYVPYGCVLFDRLVALLRTPATAIFAIYLADALGYTGSIAIVLYKSFGEAEISHHEFYRSFAYFTSILCTVCFVASAYVFLRKKASPSSDLPNRTA